MNFWPNSTVNLIFICMIVNSEGNFSDILGNDLRPSAVASGGGAFWAMWRGLEPKDSIRGNLFVIENVTHIRGREPLILLINRDWKWRTHFELNYYGACFFVEIYILVGIRLRGFRFPFPFLAYILLKPTQKGTFPFLSLASSMSFFAFKCKQR
jgi:hypothetical protein